MKIEGLRKYRGRPTISELSQPYRWQAEQNLSKMLAAARARGRELDTWYVAILCGVAKREALNPKTREWGKWMMQRRAGLARWRSALRTGDKQLERARYHSKLIRARRKRKKEEAERETAFFKSAWERNERYKAKVLELAAKGKQPFS